MSAERDRISAEIMEWRVRWGKPGAPFPLEHKQHWDLAERLAKLLAPPAAATPDLAKELTAWLDDNVRRCPHGYISITCGPCMAAWLPR